MDEATRRAVHNGRAMLSPTTAIHFHGDKFTVETVEDAEGVIEQAAYERREFTGSHGKNWLKVASIPNVLLQEWAKQDPEIMHDNAKLAAKVREMDYRKLLTAPKGYLRAQAPRSAPFLVDTRGNRLERSK
jgi:hypothetical protein